MEKTRQAQIRSAFETLWHETHTRCNRDLKRHLVIDRLRSHAESGKGVFEGSPMGNLSIEWYCHTLGWEPAEFIEQRQVFVQSVSDLAERASKTKGLIPLCDEAGQGLFGIGFLRWISVDAQQLLTGLYLGGMRDAHEIRTEVSSRYEALLGTIDHHTHNSDDAAIIAGGELYGFSAACGVWLADAIDSLEKLLPGHPDADYLLARRIRESGVTLLAQEDDLYYFTALCIIPDSLRGVLPDCSLREMITIDPAADLTGLESYLLYLADRPYSEIKLNHGKMTNLELFKWVKNRIKKIKR